MLNAQAPPPNSIPRQSFDSSKTAPQTADTGRTPPSSTSDKDSGAAGTHNSAVESQPAASSDSLAARSTRGGGEEVASVISKIPAGIRPARRENSYDTGAPEPHYENYAQRGLVDNEGWFGQLPEWRYYDAFGNKIIDGYNLYGLTVRRNTQGTGVSSIALHPFLKKWLYGLVEAADLHDDAGIMAMIGDRVKSEFTPFSFNQSWFTGARFDAFYKENYLTALTNRISNVGMYGMLVDVDFARPKLAADWITGFHGARRFGEIGDAGGTFVNIHHENSKFFNDPFSGADGDTLTRGSPTGLSLYGLNGNVRLNGLRACGEFLRSQEYLDGSLKPKAGFVTTLDARYEIFDKWKCGGEFYSIGSRFKTDFSCADPQHVDGDIFGPGKYQYSLVEDNDDKDEYPDEGKSRYDYLPKYNDPDGSIPVGYDKDRNGQWDYRQDFLSYDADPPDSRILFDRNNNAVPDEVEDDAYPDYPYVPSYYLPGQKYRRFDDSDNKLEYKYADTATLTHKGLAGLHLFTRYKILPNLEASAGGVFDRSQEKTIQVTYENGLPSGEAYDYERATSLYFLLHYKRDFDRGRSLTVDDFVRKIQDNMPNHTQDFTLPKDADSSAYYTVVDELDYRDMFGNALRAQFDLTANRGLNFTSVCKFELEKHFAHPEFNYPGMNITSLHLVNKCHYIYLLPFFKDLFFIPKYKNVWEIRNYGNAPDSPDSVRFDAKYRRNAMDNTAYLMLEWKISRKTSLTAGAQIKRFNDFNDNWENYWERGYSILATIKDRYLGFAVALTAGYAWYRYSYDNIAGPTNPNRTHNRMNNVNGIRDNIDANVIFVRTYWGVM
jgi:hypothetical protein